MALIFWNQDYAVGEKSLDNLRFAYVEVVNDLYAVMLTGHGQSESAALLGRLIEHTRSHHAAEEALLGTAGYPGLLPHREQHRSFLAAIQRIDASRQQSGQASYVQLLRCLLAWFYNHMLREDQYYRSCLKARALDAEIAAAAARDEQRNPSTVLQSLQRP